MINGGWKAYFGLENKCKSANLVMWYKISFSLGLLSRVPIILYGSEIWDCSISRDSWRKIEHIQKRFITYFPHKSNTPYPIFFIEVGLSPIENTVMTRYLMYKHKINNMGDRKLHKIALKSSQNHLRLKQGWKNDALTWLNHWGIDVNVTLQNIDTIQSIIASKFKEKIMVQ